MICLQAKLEKKVFKKNWDENILQACVNTAIYMCVWTSSVKCVSTTLRNIFNGGKIGFKVLKDERANEMNSYCVWKHVCYWWKFLRW